MKWEDLFGNNVVTGVAITAGAVLLAPVALSVVAGVGRPLARTALKSGIILYEKTRETVAELGEAFEDLVAEAKAELAQQQAAVIGITGATAANAEADEPPTP
ncbi:MAG: DUF5132 domain-containing protein [Pseudomonadales bacterium]|nr:DUF5132 domain-containing protein [Pseudomonadales bacterium]